MSAEPNKDASVPQRARRKSATLGVAALVLMGIVAVSYREWRQYSRANADAARSRGIVDTVDALLSSVVDAEAGQRGFLLTGQPHYLEPYNLAVPEIPKELARLNSLLAARPSESADFIQLENLVGERLAEMRETIELRRTEGAERATALVLSDRGKRVMDRIRASASEIQQGERSSEAQASAQGQTAAATALLTAVVGSIVLLFVFAFGLEPFASTEPQARKRSWQSRYGAAVLAVIATALFRMALTPLIGATNLPFTMFFPTVWFAAWFGGLRAGSLAVVLSTLTADYFFTAPTHSFLIAGRDDQVAALLLVTVGFGMALLSHSQQRAVERATQAETAKGKIASELRRVMDTAAVGLSRWGRDLTCFSANLAYAEIVGVRLDRIVGHSIKDVVGQAGFNAILPFIERVLSGERVEFETELPYPGGGAKWTHFIYSPDEDERGMISGWVASVTDITERRRADEAERRSELSAELLRVQDEERRRIGRDLHDSTSQSLVALKMHLDSLNAEPWPMDGARQRLQKCIRLADETIKEVRTTSYALAPPMLEEVGLKSAIPWYVDGFMERSGISTRFDAPPNFTRPAREVESALYRVLQESLTNVLRHSGSPVALVELGMEDGLVRLEISDKGKGIPPEVLDALGRDLPGKLGVGLRGMRERVRQLGGKLEVSSSADGTTVCAMIPRGISS